MDCSACNAACCRYFATQIDTPTCKRDYDHIRWYLLHEHVHVFIDEHRHWYLEVATVCRNLGPDGRCTDYENRPLICRRHGEEDGVQCEFTSRDGTYRERFSSAAELEAYLDGRGIDWRFRR